jgi:hypothetical protein
MLAEKDQRPGASMARHRHRAAAAAERKHGFDVDRRRSGRNVAGQSRSDIENDS